MDNEMDQLIRALANPTRLAILQMVWNGRAAAGTIAAKIELAPASVSEHLKVLRKSGWVSVEKSGTSWIYFANHESMKRLRYLLNQQFPLQNDEG